MSAILRDPLLRIRPLREDDIDAIMTVEHRCYDHPWTAGIFRDSLRVGYVCWGYFLDRRLVGYGVMSVAAGEAHVLNICTDPEMRGQGLARRLMQRLINQAREREADTVFLEVRASNRVALGLYESLGFNEIGLRRGYYPADKGREDAILLAKAL
ncbi:ribosomal protein S18-alanine N-acetyltransferase [Sedimenticola selenatireducens]|uniref:[Ribosomal protein bS18]-alanine N-acetyltransferase n=1 Tax=Sedimenticola selenatireducens TaxID=191960 RepID=A0A2N6CRR8_9GAMM|nr:ribosomal protein S18-alanine N-acetyltransferase [Sedimenticola selenatireducens]PLX59768.1 MAG: ribosomal-protein-alanine N-acetyltransferase [Sedimenticola selenatireducens]